MFLFRFNGYLQDWAKLGECKKNPDYMNIYCSKVYSINKSKNQLNDNETLQSCKKCSGGCEDENKSCAQWAKKVILLSFILTVVVFILFQVFYFWRQPLEITPMCFRATVSQESTQIT